MNETPWYVTFFAEDYLRIYSPFLPAERTAREVEGIIRLLNIPQEGHILDLCCGYGRHAIPLALRGYQVTGQDLSSFFLQRAQAEATMRNVTVRWQQGDMRTIPFDHEFDAVINIFTSFGYLGDEEDQRVLRQVAKALKPGGHFLLETVHQARIIRTSSPQSIIRYSDDLIVLEERHIDLLKSRDNVRITMLHPDGRRTEHTQSIRIYTLTELIRMLEAAGLQVQAYYGGLDESPLTLESRLAILSQKATTQ